MTCMPSKSKWSTRGQHSRKIIVGLIMANSLAGNAHKERKKSQKKLWKQIQWQISSSGWSLSSCPSLSPHLCPSVCGSTLVCFCVVYHVTCRFLSYVFNRTISVALSWWRVNSLKLQTLHKMKRQSETLTHKRKKRNKKKTWITKYKKKELELYDKVSCFFCCFKLN